MLRDIFNHINPVRMISPQVQTNSSAAIVSQIIDLQGIDSILFLILTGALTDADATFAVTMEHGDASDLSDTAAPAADDLLGTLALASFAFSDDDKCFKLAYKGIKRYVRLTITPTGNNSGSANVAVVAVTVPRILATSNPPA